MQQTIYHLNNYIDYHFMLHQVIDLAVLLHHKHQWEAYWYI